ncbi:hypothetical protein AK812_SmicGene48122, partial [Symbiodinium microadriaticum]
PWGSEAQVPSARGEGSIGASDDANRHLRRAASVRHPSAPSRKLRLRGRGFRAVGGRIDETAARLRGRRAP